MVMVMVMVVKVMMVVEFLDFEQDQNSFQQREVLKDNKRVETACIYFESGLHISSF